MNFVKLKLIYLADREALDTEGHSISTDTWASMKHGPVPICTYNLVGGGGDPDNAVWDEFIEDGSNYMVHLRKHPGMVYLSESEQSVVKKVFDKYGGLPVWGDKGIVEFTHTLEEWENVQDHPLGPHSKPISVRSILRALKKSDEEIEAILDLEESSEWLDSIMRTA